eukprot:GEMP01050950.1.p1 GENE.GEMP01050950.1~~GEMP01050950.1.p1  ORF type:complete len:337 (+),score=69.36 GEMP01050950.1:27-1013(+)
MDPYAILGVPRGSSFAVVKKQFRLKAKQVHPDKNPDDKKAAARFRELHEAFKAIEEQPKVPEVRPPPVKKVDVRTQHLRTDLERREREAALARQKAREKVLPKVATNVKEEYKRVVEERSQQKQAQQANLEKRLRQEVARHAKVSLLLKSNVITPMALALKFQEILQPYGLLKTEAHEYSALLTFESREGALDATIFLKNEKAALGFLRKVVIGDNDLTGDNVQNAAETQQDSEGQAESPAEKKPARGGISRETLGEMEEELDRLAGIRRPNASTEDTSPAKRPCPSPKPAATMVPRATASRATASRATAPAVGSLDDMEAELEAMLA